MLKKHLKLSTIVFFAASLSFCSSYKTPIQQGGLIDNEEISLLTTGMKKQDVETILGSPSLIDSFRNGENWDYIYFQKINGQLSEKKLLSLQFEDNHLKDIRSSIVK